MSYLEQVQKVSDAHYVLPKVGAMRVDVHAFLSEALFAQTDEALWRQAAAAAAYPGIIGLYLMPDTHLGYGIPVGGVAVTDDVDHPGRQRLRHLVRRRLHAVAGLHAARRRRLGPAQALDPRGRDARRDRRRQPPAEAHAARVRGEGRGDLSLRCKGDRRVGGRLRAPVHPRRRSDARHGRIGARARQGVPQLGSVGGGNHFVEMQVDVDDGSVWVMIHCGSRGYGWQTANHYFYAGAELRGLPKNRREESWLRADEPLGREYWAHHNSAANYAVANRHSIVRGVQQALETCSA